MTQPRSAPEPVLRFATAANFEAWLDADRGDHPGIWLEIAKKGSRDRSVTYAEAIEIALCLGGSTGRSGAATTALAAALHAALSPQPVVEDQPRQG